MTLKDLTEAECAIVRDDVKISATVIQNAAKRSSLFSVPNDVRLNVTPTGDCHMPERFYCSRKARDATHTMLQHQRGEPPFDSSAMTVY